MPLEGSAHGSLAAHELSRSGSNHSGALHPRSLHEGTGLSPIGSGGASSSGTGQLRSWLGGANNQQHHNNNNNSSSTPQHHGHQQQNPQFIAGLGKRLLETFGALSTSDKESGEQAHAILSLAPLPVASTLKPHAHRSHGPRCPCL